jgi:hypothetical protein
MTFADDSNVVNSLHHISEGPGQNPKVVQSQPQIQLSHPTSLQPQTHTTPIQRLVLAPASTQHGQAHAQAWHQSARQLEPQRPLQTSPMQNLHPEDDTLSIERQSINLEQASHSQQHLNFREIMDPYFHPNPTGQPYPNPRPFLKTSPANLFQRDNMSQNGSANTGNEHFNEYNSRKNLKTVSVTDDAVKVTSKGNEF